MTTDSTTVEEVSVLRRENQRTRTVLALQIVTLGWMLVECGVSLYAAQSAHSAALLAFGSDSFVELLSAGVVLAAAAPALRLSEERANRYAGLLLGALTAIVALVAATALARGAAAETSRTGIAITVAALVIMPVLAWLKRRVARSTSNSALAADAVQSATCAYLALVTLAGLGINAAFHAPRIDAVAALAAVPILAIETRRTLKGDGCC